jgi:hypothetical protein
VPVPVDSTLIASLSWIGKLHLRIEEVAPTEAAAADTTESLQTILVLLKSMENSDVAKGFDADTRTFLNSVSVDRHRNEAVLTATVPTALLQRFLNQPQDLRVAPEAAGGAGQGAADQGEGDQGPADQGSANRGAANQPRRGAEGKSGKKP